MYGVRRPRRLMQVVNGGVAGALRRRRSHVIARPLPTILGPSAMGERVCGKIRDCVPNRGRHINLASPCCNYKAASYYSLRFFFGCPTMARTHITHPAHALLMALQNEHTQFDRPVCE